MVGGSGVRLGDESHVVDGELFLCLEVDRGRAEALVRCASIVHREWLPAHQLRRETAIFFDATSERVCARQRVFWQDLLLDQSPTGIDDPARAAAVLNEAARQHWPHVFSMLPSAVRSLVTRVRCLRDWMPELDLPPLGDAQLQELLPPLCQGCKGFEDLQRAAWLSAIQQTLGYQHLPTVEREAPQHLVVPSGRSLPLRYEEGKAPVLAARIQELFGLAETPRVARGRIPVLLHLLAPNMRPQQITDDLPSFWRNTYPEVRKQLRGRYPKHAWPESPSPGN
jgi:ATP-dependent helicase HrpB